MSTKDIVNISLFVTLLSVCAWICIPTAVPFTMQTFAVFLAMLVLGGKKGTIVIGVYLILGIIGVPVFSRGTAGLGILFGNTGGYMFGWIFIGLIMAATERTVDKIAMKKKESRQWILIAGMLIGLAVCYLFGTLWFMNVYTGEIEGAWGQAVLGTCVIPFIIPDLMKMFLAFAVSKRIRKIVVNV